MDKYRLICLFPLVKTNGSEGDDEANVFLVESLSALLCPMQFTSHGIDPRTLLISETKAWHIWIDCVVFSIIDQLT